MSDQPQPGAADGSTEELTEEAIAELDRQQAASEDAAGFAARQAAGELAAQAANPGEATTQNVPADPGAPPVRRTTVAVVTATVQPATDAGAPAVAGDRPPPVRAPLRTRVVAAAAERLHNAGTRVQALNEPPANNPQGTPPRSLGMWVARIVLGILVVLVVLELGVWTGYPKAAIGFVGAAIGAWVLLTLLAGLYRTAWPAQRSGRAWSLTGTKVLLMLFAGAMAVFWSYPSDVKQFASQGVEAVKSHLNSSTTSSDSKAADKAADDSKKPVEVAKVETPKAPPQKPAAETPKAKEIRAQIATLYSANENAHSEMLTDFRNLMGEGDNAQRARVEAPANCAGSPYEVCLGFYPELARPLTDEQLTTAEADFQTALTQATAVGGDTPEAIIVLEQFGRKVTDLRESVVSWKETQSGLLDHLRELLACVTPEELTDETFVQAYNKVAGEKLALEQQGDRQRKAAQDKVVSQAKELKATQNAELRAIREAVSLLRDVRLLPFWAMISRGPDGIDRVWNWGWFDMTRHVSDKKWMLDKVLDGGEKSHLGLLRSIEVTTETAEGLNAKTRQLFGDKGPVVLEARKALAQFRACSPESVPAEDVRGYLSHLALDGSTVDDVFDVTALVATFVPEDFAYPPEKKAEFLAQAKAELRKARVDESLIESPGKVNISKYKISVRKWFIALRYLSENHPPPKPLVKPD